MDSNLFKMRLSSDAICRDLPLLGLIARCRRNSEDWMLAVRASRPIEECRPVLKECSLNRGRCSLSPAGDSQVPLKRPACKDRVT